MFHNFQVGFHSGFERFYVLPHSGVDAIVNVSRESNVCTPGRFVFRISGPDIDDLTYTGEGTSSANFGSFHHVFFKKDLRFFS
ncbi:hypothetical protein DPMN_153557 [Dreissena polymorpha]|uniref:NIDO domain-containing protein n=1 Tax=Dreissena polymorpha TaxID=45954 RepID=A0A9D4FMJ7_DREPO|nr:hypothetical protein DPMN_153557 [Dreissena polymorpha]